MARTTTMRAWNEQKTTIFFGFSRFCCRSIRAQRQQQRAVVRWMIWRRRAHSSAQCRMYTFGESLIFVTTSIPNNEYVLAFCLSTHIIKNTKPFCKLHSMAIFPSAFPLSLFASLSQHIILFPLQFTGKRQRQQSLSSEPRGIRDLWKNIFLSLVFFPSILVWFGFFIIIEYWNFTIYVYIVVDGKSNDRKAKGEIKTT